MSEKHPDKQKKKQDEPLSLYPMTMDEALKRAMDTPPIPKDDSKRSSEPKSKSNT